VNNHSDQSEIMIPLSEFQSRAC